MSVPECLEVLVMAQRNCVEHQISLCKEVEKLPWSKQGGLTSLVYAGSSLVCAKNSEILRETETDMVDYLRASGVSRQQ